VIAARAYPKGHVMAVEDAWDVTHLVRVITTWSDEHIFQLACEARQLMGTHHQPRERDLSCVNCLWCLTGADR